jgi:hypothetical protein
VIKIKNWELYRKCKLLSGLNRVIVETLLELLFEKVDVIDIQKAYLENEVAGVKRLIRKKLKEGEEQVKKTSLKEKLKVEGFWQSS